MVGSVSGFCRFTVLSLAVGLAMMLAPAASADVIIGNGSTTNIFPFGSFAYVGEYQQVYSGSPFPGAVTINSVSFKTAGGSSVPHTLAFTLSLSTTSAAPNAMSTSYAANRGADFTTVFSGPFNYTPLINGTFDFVVPVTPFNYDPAHGNLLVDVNITTADSPSNVSFANGIDPLTSRVFNLGGSGAATADSFGLLTRFGTGQTPAAPEPSALALAGSGSVLALVFAWRRRRRL